MAVLLCLGYLVVGVVSAGLLLRFDLVDTDDGLSAVPLLLVSIAWPVFIALHLLFCVFMGVHKIIMKIGGK